METFLWDQRAQEIFDQLIARTPIFLRAIAKDKVGEKAIRLAREQQHAMVTEQDIVDAFFAETPFGFHGPMKIDMEAVGVDYTRYGYSR